MSVALEHSQADIVRWLIIALGEGTDPASNEDWPVSAAIEPYAPDNCITVYDTEGIQQGRLGPTRKIQESLGLQVRIRAINHKDGFLKAYAIRHALSESVRNALVTVDTTTYLVYSLVKFSSVLPLGKDSSAGTRRLFTFNCLVNLVWHSVASEETGTGGGLTGFEILDEDGEVILDENGEALYDEFFV